MISIARLISNGKGTIKNPDTGRVLDVNEATKFIIEAEEKEREKRRLSRRSEKVVVGRNNS